MDQVSERVRQVVDLAVRVAAEQSNQKVRQPVTADPKVAELLNKLSLSEQQSIVGLHIDLHSGRAHDDLRDMRSTIHQLTQHIEEKTISPRIRDLIARASQNEPDPQRPGQQRRIVIKGELAAAISGFSDEEVLHLVEAYRSHLICLSDQDFAVSSMLLFLGARAVGPIVNVLDRGRLSDHARYSLVRTLGEIGKPALEAITGIISADVTAQPSSARFVRDA
jgi:hypothetical protein